MTRYINTENGGRIAVIESETPILTDVQSALDLIATEQFVSGCMAVAMYKSAVAQAFFDLSTGIAGEILQKFTIYRQKIAIIGDFSSYPSKALQDFIYECNQGNQVFFVADEEEAVRRLT